MWLDGVVYYAVYETLISDNTGNGQHLRDTIFASEQSFLETGDGNRESENWYRHSYAMNEDIQHDHLYSGSSAKLTNKTLANITSTANCVLFIENSSSNVIGAGDRTSIIQTGKDRWGSEKIHAAFLDGSARKLTPDDIPAGGDDDVESSRFWKGVKP